MGELLQGKKRTVLCGQLSKKDIASMHTVMGWVQRRRDLGGLVFIWLRDKSGIVQIVFNSETNIDLFNKISSVRSEYVLAITGEVVAREANNINKELSTGEIEIIAEELLILSSSETPPFEINDDVTVNEALRFKYRYLDLRRPSAQYALQVRHKIAITARNFFDKQGFMEVETPMLTKSTPEGARDYLVPSRVQPGKFFALPQSPQLFKQLLMVSGIDRYYQIVKCFRDEDLRADRQPEFTQIDIEMSFVEPEDVMDISEQMLAEVFKAVLNVDVALPLPKITYKEAMERYGSDKPDTRYSLELVNISHLVGESTFSVFSNAVSEGGSVRGINAKGCAERFSRKDIDALTQHIKTYRAKGLAWIAITAEGYRSSINKFFTDEQLKEIADCMNGQIGDMLFIVADTNKIVFDALGQLRQEVARRADLIDNSKYNLLWVTEFPLLEYDDENGRYVAMHHPFTSPMDEDLEKLGKDNLAIRAKAYDIVLNGYELGGGSIRIHSSEIQQKMFAQLGFSQEDIQNRFGFLVDAFKYGAPPHGGLAFGLDRIAMLMCGADSLRDVIAFPKMQNASCLLTSAPSDVEEKQLIELNIALSLKKENI